jgi:hypothetical protein
VAPSRSEISSRLCPRDREGVLLFRRRVKRAGLRRNCYIIPHDLVDKPRFADLTKEIANSGGFAGVDFKGLFLVYLPTTSESGCGEEQGTAPALPAHNWCGHVSSWNERDTSGKP